MNKEHTDKKLLNKGIKYMVIALPLLFASPYLITLSALNKNTTLPFLLFLIVGIIIGILSIYFCFKGLRTILKAIF